MLKRNHAIPFILGLILILTCSCRHRDRVTPADNAVVPEGNGWTPAVEELGIGIAEIERLYKEYSKGETAGEAVDVRAMMELLVSEAYTRGLDKDEEISKEISAFVDQTLIAAAKEVYADKYKIQPDELIRAYRRRRKKLRMGHVWVKIADEGLVSRIVHQLHIGASIETMAEYRATMSRTKEREQVVLEIKTITGGDMINELEEVAYGLKWGQVKVVKTKSGYHILKLLEKIFRRRPSLTIETDDIEKRLRRAKVEEDGGLDVDRMKEEGQLRVDEKLLQLMEFPPSLSPDQIGEPEENQVVAEILSDTVTVGELKSKVSRLPPRVQRRFENKYTREAAVRRLLVNEALNRERYRQAEERQLFERLLKTDTTEERDDIIETLRRLKMNSGAAMISGSDERDSVRIDRKTLSAMTIVNPERPQNSMMLATFEGGGITVGSFREEIDKLPMEAKRHLAELENRREFLEYVVFSKYLLACEDDPELQINEDILKEVDHKQKAGVTKVGRTKGEELIPFAEIEEMEIPDFSEPIARLGKVVLTVGRLEERVSRMSVEERAVLKESGKRPAIVESLLIEEAWLREAHDMRLGDRDDIKRKIGRRKEHLMVRKLYDISNSPSGPEMQ